MSNYICKVPFITRVVSYIHSLKGQEVMQRVIGVILEICLRIHKWQTRDDAYGVGKKKRIQFYIKFEMSLTYFNGHIL